MEQIDLTGKSLGGYRILRKLGQGGMAVVYKAHEESLNRVVALKVIGQHLSDNPDFIERFKREAQAAAQLSHPNIVQIYAIGEDRGIHYFSMEYIKGRSLADVVEEEGFITAGRAVPIIAQAAEALAVAHDAGIVHRDIKPPNIMLDEAGRAKVADFGIAQMATASRMTQSGMLVGTPEYISPEQCRGEKLDGRGDIYALGVTLYNVLTGRTPFEADTPAALVLQIVEGNFPPVGHFNPTVPLDVQEIVARMTHNDRNQRYQSAEDLLHALKKADTRPITKEIRVPGAAPPTAPEPTEVAAPLSGTETVPAPPAATEAMSGPPGATEAMPTPTAATEAMPSPPAATEAMPSPPAPTEAMPAPPGTAEATAAEPPPTVALPPREDAPDAPPAAATAAPTVPAAPGPPADDAKDKPASAPPPQSAPQKASPATQAYATKSQQRNPVILIAAAAAVVIVLLFLGWQFLPMGGRDEATGPVASDDPASAAAQTGDDATANAGAAGTAEGGETANDPTGGENQPVAGGGAEAGAVTTDPNATATDAAATDPATTDPDATDPAAAATQQATTPPQQAPPPAVAQPQPEEPEVTFVPPPVNSIVAATSGEYEYVDLVGAWVEEAFGGQGFQLVDYPASPYGSMQEAARFLVTTTATLVSAQELAYYGNVQMQYTVGLTMRATDLADGVTTVGPLTATVQYTSINMQQNLERETTDLARRLARELRQVIRVP